MARQYTQTNQIPYLAANSLASDIQPASYELASRVDQLLEDVKRSHGAEAVAQLQTDVSNAASKADANAKSLSTLTTRVKSAEDRITALEGKGGSNAALMVCARTGAAKRTGDTSFTVIYQGYDWQTEQIAGGGITRKGSVFTVTPGIYLVTFKVALAKPVTGFAFNAIKVNGGQPQFATPMQGGVTTPSAPEAEIGLINLHAAVEMKSGGTIETVGAHNANDMPEFCTLTIARI
ncbi:hypothetical protein [Gulosibacter bifidus]|uniref:C1q domain-containing protein n=1 Tax=Gulosibacter bifidus TaxID=272239 RepID=A0ABW5RJX2_9MICO|nr:hypothetical protein [Gulosibacter bifidus]